LDLFQTLVLALVQGLTEFLPISSAAHLILVPELTDWDDQGLTFDVATHVGTLAAVMIYFRHEIRRMAVEWLGSLRGRASPRMRSSPGRWVSAPSPPRWPVCCSMT
jgi:undecaprenyl-diphosphatase